MVQGGGHDIPEQTRGGGRVSGRESSTMKPRRLTLQQLLAGVRWVPMVGFCGLVALIFLGFEEPHSTLLWLSALFLFAPIGVVLLHVLVTRQLTAAQRRRWWRRMRGRRALPSLASLYWGAFEPDPSGEEEGEEVAGPSTTPSSAP
jgi:hypothetical protein